MKPTFRTKNRKKFRLYGKKPHNLIIVHGGPGSCGEMKPVAENIIDFVQEKEISAGVMEPFLVQSTISGQIEEIKKRIEQFSFPPCILIGFSWGAWMVFLFAAKYPDLVKKVILIGAGPFESKYTSTISDTRISRLSAKEEREYKKIMVYLQQLGQKSSPEKSQKYFWRLGELAEKADCFKKESMEKFPFRDDSIIQMDPNDAFKTMNEAQDLRRNGFFLKVGRNIRCPVYIIHGNYDSHPFLGVKKPLLKIFLKSQIKFYLLQKCGHKPWIEKYASSKFYSILKKILAK